ncbi:HTH domain-containing protein [Candidatus Woesearchaeota archaeon]|nr:HTH domain-containing protein [Candidatus Woesearchaeota archaeon]
MMQKEEKIPVSLFKNDLGPLEAVVKFLKENKNLTLKQIALKLNRSSKTIWTTYNNVRNEKLKVSASFHFIPISFLSKKKLSILESIASYLKDVESLTFHQIAELTGRDDRTIWTCHHRAVLKIEKNLENE